MFNSVKIIMKKFFLSCCPTNVHKRQRMLILDEFPSWRLSAFQVRKVSGYPMEHQWFYPGAHPQIEKCLEGHLEPSFIKNAI